MPKAMPIARNADRNPNLEVSMKGYKMPKKSMKMSYGSPMSNAIRAANVKRMGKKNPGY